MIIQKVQIFEIDSPSKLQYMINNFLKTKRSTEIVDIKYNHYIDPTMDDNENTWYTAMVIYTDFPDDDEESVPTGEERNGYAVRRPL